MQRESHSSIPRAAVNGLGTSSSWAGRLWQWGWVTTSPKVCFSLCLVPISLACKCWASQDKSDDNSDQVWAHATLTSMSIQHQHLRMQFTTWCLCLSQTKNWTLHTLRQVTKPNRDSSTQGGIYQMALGDSSGKSLIIFNFTYPLARPTTSFFSSQCCPCL